MECPYCQSSTTTERPETTVRRYRRFRCRACEQGFSGRISSVSTRVHYPPEVACLVVLWRVRYKPKSNHRRFVHFLTRCGVFPVRPERSAAKSKATGPARSLLFDFAAGTATLRANGWCFLKEFHTVPMSCGLI